MTTTLQSGWATPDLVDRSAPTPLCWFCLDQQSYDFSVGREPFGAAVASVMFGGKFACSWHAGLMFEDEPARLFLKSEAACA